jgi:hypothetical protein
MLAACGWPRVHAAPGCLLSHVPLAPGLSRTGARRCVHAFLFAPLLARVTAVRESGGVCERCVVYVCTVSTAVDAIDREAAAALQCWLCVVFGCACGGNLCVPPVPRWTALCTTEFLWWKCAADALPIMRVPSLLLPLLYTRLLPALRVHWLS